jgi:predicted phage terminase large subunit-like protein|nr:MAG TPA: Large Terminase [Caudoviricetes sp.]
MATKAEIIKAQERWKQHCETVQTATAVNINETQAQRLARIRHLRTDYAAFVDYYFPHWTVNPETGKATPCAPFHVSAANKILKDRNLKAAFQWHRGAAKSTNMDVFVPMWLMAQEHREINVMVLVGKSEDNAKTLLGDIQAELQYNQRYIHDFGEQYNAGSWEEGQFVTRSEVAFFARGRGQSPRGLRYRSHRPDYVVIDDLDDDELVESPARVSKLFDWVRSALFGTLDGGRGRFIMVGNLIAKNSVLAKWCDIKSVHVTRVNIYDNKGGISWASKWTPQEVKNIEDVVGYRAFQKEYMNNPIIEGAIFRNEWIRWGKRPAWSKFSEIVLYIDPSFKGSTKNDYKAAKLWGKAGTLFYHLRAFVRQSSVAEMVRWCYDLYEWTREQGISVRWYMEANFMQDTILDEFRREGELRGYQLPITGDKRKKPDKFQRVEAISPLWERGFVVYDETQRDDPDMLAGIDQTLAFEKGMRGHDDAPDADEGAIWMLQRDTRAKSFNPSFGRRTNAKNVSW